MQGILQGHFRVISRVLGYQKLLSCPLVYVRLGVSWLLPATLVVRNVAQSGVFTGVSSF
jgi:hypothetical protein